MEILHDDIGFSYLEKLSTPRLTFLEWMRDECCCVRPVCGIRSSRLATSEVAKSYKSKPDFDYERRGTIPNTQLTEFLKTFVSYESFTIVGILICLQQFLYDSTFMPIKAMNAFFKILFNSLATVVVKDGKRVMKRTATRSTAGSSPVASRAHRRLESLAFTPGYALLQRLITWGKFVCISLSGGIHSTTISNLSSFLVCICSYWLFNHFITFAAAYHFIRSQSLLKLYVLFNLLEVVDKILRSLERDAIYELIVKMRSAFQSGIHSTQNGATTSNERTTQLETPPIERAASDLTHTKADVCEKVRVEHISITGGTELLQMVLILLVSVFCVCTHMVLHLARGLLLCISMNSEPSAMFLLLFSNNWAEIKSTIFKKQTMSSLFTVGAADVIERFQLLTDALFVYLQTNSALRSELGSSSATKVFKWVILMLSIEICVDFIKHAYLIKFNRLSHTVFESFEWILAYDFLVSRSATLLVTKEVDPIDRPPVSLLGIAPFPRIPAERLGFQTLALLTFLASCIPLDHVLNNAFWALTTSVLLWFLLVGLNYSLTIYLMMFCIRRVAQRQKVEGALIGLTPL